MTKIPTKPAGPISFHIIPPTTNVSNGAVHKEFTKNIAQSNRLTSFDRRFTTFPGDASPRAVCDSRRDLNEEKTIYINHILDNLCLITCKCYLSVNETTNRYSNFHPIVIGAIVNMIDNQCIQSI